MRTCQLRIEPAGWPLAANTGRTLLESADQAGIALPSSCRNGTCRTCLCQLTQGQIHYRIDWPGLSAEEKAEGWVLPCVAYPLTDVTLQQTRAVRTGVRGVSK
jgi:ferredoxin